MSIGIGDALRDAREEQGRTIEDAGRDTRVRGDYLRALEEERFDILGGDVYAKGFLSSYARYLRLDPQPLLDLYRRHVQQDDYDTAAIATNPVTRQPSTPPPTWLAWAVVVIVVMVGVAALAQIFGGRTPEPAAVQDPSPNATPTASAPPDVVDEPEPSPEPTVEGVNLVITYEGRSWTRVIVDGQNVLEDTIERGESLTFQGSDEIVVRFGDPGAVRVELNGDNLGAQGEPGQPRTVTFTPDGPAEA